MRLQMYEHIKNIMLLLVKCVGDKTDTTVGWCISKTKNKTWRRNLKKNSGFLEKYFLKKNEVFKNPETHSKIILEELENVEVKNNLVTYKELTI